MAANMVNINLSAFQIEEAVKLYLRRIYSFDNFSMLAKPDGSYDVSFQSGSSDNFYLNLSHGDYDTPAVPK